MTPHELELVNVLCDLRDILDASPRERESLLAVID